MESEDRLRRSEDIHQAIRSIQQAVRRPYQGIVFSSDALFYWAEHKNDQNIQNLRLIGFNVYKLVIGYVKRLLSITKITN